MRTYKEIASAACLSVGTVISILKLYCLEGLEKAVTPRWNNRSDIARLKAIGDAKARLLQQHVNLRRKGGYDERFLF